VFDNTQKSSTILQEIGTLVSSTNIVGTHKVFIIGERSLVYILNSKDPSTNNWRISCFIFP
jgi:hypothetical protein